MWDRLLRNARVVDPVNGHDGVMDVAVKDGRIAAVGPNLQGEASEVEDLTGLVVMPGLIDPHLHLGSMFGSAYGTRMAAAAGVTTCLDMAGRRNPRDVQDLRRRHQRRDARRLLAHEALRHDDAHARAAREVCP